MNLRTGPGNWLRYGAAVSLVAVAVGTKVLVDAYSIAETPFFLVRGAVLIGAYLFGLGPALVALFAASIAVEYFVLPPIRSLALTGASLVRLIAFFGETLLIIWIIITLKKARHASDKAAVDLVESQSLFRQFMENNPAVAFMKDEIGRHVYVNRTGETMFGWTEGEWKNKTGSQLWPPSVAETHHAHDQEVLQTGKLTRFLESGDLPGRGHADFEVYKFPLITGGGERFVGAIAIDVTERLQTDRALREQQAEFRQLADSMPQIVWTADARGNIGYFNRRWYEFTGFVHAEVEGEDASWTSILHPEEVKPAAQHFEESLSTGASFVRECRFRNLKGGDYRWFLVRAMPVRSEQGEITRWYGTATDIHEQKTAVESANNSERRFRSLVTTSSQIIWTADGSGAFIERQPSWEAYSGQTPEQHLGFGWQDALHPDERQEVAVTFGRALETISPFKVGGRIWYALTQQYRYFEMQAVPLIDDSGTLCEWIGTITDVDEQHRAEEAVQASSQRIHDIFESMTDAFFAMDRNWLFTYVNRQAEHLLHRKRETLIGKSIWIEFPGALGTRFQTEYERAMAARLPVQFEEYYPSLFAWFEVYVYPAEDGLSVYFRNITERRRAEDALRLSEAEFRATYEQAAVGIAQISVTGQYMRINAKFCEICGRTSEQLENLTYLDVTHPDDQQAEADLLRKLFEGNIPSYTYEKRYLLPEGTTAWVRVTSSLAGEPDMDGTYRIAIVEDISDARRAEEQLARSEQRYRSLVTALAQIVWRTNAQGEIDDMPEWRALTGQSVEQVRGRGWLDALHPDDREHVARTWIDAVETESVYETEYRIRLADGSYRWFSARGAPVQEEDGSVREWVGICVDVNDQKKAEQHMQQAAEAMALARDAAVQANRAKSAFLANMSHELRTPLNAILGYSELLQEDLGPTAPEQVLGDLARISTAGNSLLGLVNDVLDLSKIEAGRMTLELSEFEVGEVLSEVVATVLPLCERNRNALDLQNEQELGTLYADRTKLRQALVNLLSNACKFTENGQVQVLFRREVEQNGADFAIFTVSDSGIGIAPEDQERLFQEFTQLDPSFTRKYSGTGLGLAISRRFVEMMGGTISVNSTLGQGSTFSVVLPARVQAAKPAAGRKLN